MKILQNSLIFMLVSSSAFAGTSTTLKLSNSFTTNQVNDFDTGLDDGSYSFIQSSAYSGSNTEQNYLILEGFEEIDVGDSTYLQSELSVVDTDGVIKEFGAMQVDLSLPSAPENVSYSPIVGIIPRLGSFDLYEPVYNSSDIDDQCEGSIRLLDDGSGEFRCIISGQLFIGAIRWELNDSNELLLEAFSISDGSLTYAFDASTLYYLNGSYSGSLNRMDENATFENMTLALSINAYDTDRDGEADIYDTNTEYWFGPNFYPYSKGNTLSDVQNADLFWSEWFGNFTILDDGVEWIYHFDHGYFYPSIPLGDGNEYDAWLYDTVLGWVYISSKDYNTATGRRYIYDYAKSRWLYFYGPDGDERIFYDEVAEENIRISKSL